MIATATQPQGPLTQGQTTLTPIDPPLEIQTGTLSWSLVVATYRREKVLPRCIRCALQSSRRPLQVIVVDASPYWEQTKSAVLGEFQANHPDVEFLFVGARRASLTAQRNQGLELTRSDIAFMIDDDSLLFPDTAEKIMSVYDQDTEQKVVALTPMFVKDVPDAHLKLVTPGHAVEGHAGMDESKSNGFRKVLRKLLWSNIQLLPYDGQFAAGAIPASVAHIPLIAARFSTGSATFRTKAVQKAKFEEVLERYAAGEDWDISEKIKSKGLIAFVPGAKQCHLEAPGGRLSRKTVLTLRYLNFMALHVLHSTDMKRSRKMFRQFMWRRLISELLADGSKKNWNFPRFRGTWSAFLKMGCMLRKSPDQIRAWYPQFQRELVASDKGEERAR